MGLNLPALLVMGPPHSGKSVLAYHLSRRLYRAGLAHYLLRTAPDGEGNWFYEGPRNKVLSLRLAAKGRYTPDLVRRMVTLLQHRHTPLLVDMGGRPRGEQWEILRACTHGILLYRTPEEREYWMAHIRATDLSLLAVLESRLQGEDVLAGTHPYLTGTITGLDRHHPRLGKTFEALARRVFALFRLREEDLEALHRKTAPYPFLSERELARTLGKPLPAWWTPEDLPRLLRVIPRGPVSLYGRGPTWLAAAIAAHVAPAPMAVFDAHLGWVHLPQVDTSGTKDVLLHMEPVDAGRWLLRIQLRGFLMPTTLPEPNWPKAMRSVILWGRLPRWVYGTYAQALARRIPHIAVWEPRLQRAVTIFGFRADTFQG